MLQPLEHGKVADSGERCRAPERADVFIGTLVTEAEHEAREPHHHATASKRHGHGAEDAGYNREYLGAVDVGSQVLCYIITSLANSEQGHGYSGTEQLKH